MLIHSPQLPPKAGYVEVEVNGIRTYRNTQTGVLIGDEARSSAIAARKQQLAETDYQIIKCSEYQLAGVELPYDIAALHAQRQAIRDQINELEAADAEQQGD